MTNLLIIISLGLSILSLSFIDIYKVLIILAVSFGVALLFPTKKYESKKEIKKITEKRFLKIYIFLIISSMTNLFASFLIFALLYVIWEIVNFIIFKLMIKEDKKIITTNSKNNISIDNSIKSIFTKLNKRKKINLKESTIDEVGKKLSALQDTMPIENVSEIFTSFIFWYILKGNMFNNPTNISDEYILSSVENMNIKKGKKGFELKYKQKK
ncbi:MAG: hypothetical protein WC164_01955 [Patescibacteria group bacterium]|nr:hypothetical protein [bacterium]